MRISRFEGARLQRLQNKFEPDPWGALVVAAPAFMRGKERFSAPGEVPLRLCALALGIEKSQG
jgi:hypothetical protein